MLKVTNLSRITISPNPICLISNILEKAFNLPKRRVCWLVLLLPGRDAVVAPGQISSYKTDPKNVENMGVSLENTSLIARTCSGYREAITIRGHIQLIIVKSLWELKSLCPMYYKLIMPLRGIQVLMY